MAKLSLVKGTTSHRSYIFIQDSSVTTGAGKTGLAFNTASLVAYYVQPGGSATAITLATQTVTGAYSSGGFVEVDATNMPGVYRLDIPNAALTGANSVVIMLKGAANMAPVVLEIELTAVDNQDSVRYGMTALPNVAAGANGGLPTGNASGQVAVASFANNAITAASIAADAITAAKIADGAIDAATFAADAITASAIATDAIGSAEVSAAAVTKIQAGLSTYAGGAVASVTGNVGGNVVGSVGSVASAVTVGTNNDKTGYALSPAAVQAIWDALTSALTQAGSIGKLLVDNINATISSRLATAGYTAPDNANITAIKNKTDLIPAAGPASAADYTALRAAKLDNLDVAVSTRGTGDATAASQATINANVLTRLPTASYTPPPSATDNADALLDRADGVESGRTVRQALRLALASLAGKLSGAATNTVTIRDTNDAKNRITATVDADGNRTAVSYDVS